MRTKSLLPLFLISVMASVSMLWGQNTYVPDDNFEQALIDLGYDDTLDDYVLTANISGVTYLNIGENDHQISDLTGIEDFTALNHLDCSYNQLTSLDVSANTALTILECGNNPLTSLDVSMRPDLTHLNCRNTQLTSLDLSNNTALETLYFENNEFTSLDVSANTSLTVLGCSSNQLTSLDVSSNTALELLYANQNDLTSLDLSNNTALIRLYCQNNQLIHLNMKNGVTDQLLTFEAFDNPLDCIEVNEEDIAWATENWTYENGNIDEGVEFSVVCAPEGYTYVPDNNFEQALIDLGHDTALDDFVLTENISSVTSLDVEDKEISDLTGIEDFTALTQLLCYDNQLTSLNVSNNTALTILSCSWNQLTSLDVSNNTVLVQLHLNNNQLTSLDVSNNTVLTNLDCSSNQLIHLNMKNGVTDQLTEFNATDNTLTCIEVNEEDVDWATENWTYENGNIDEGVEFSVVCVPEGYTYVPDNNFEQALVDLGYDSAVDDFVLTENISGVTYLEVNGEGISDLTGIEDFTALEDLRCENNQLTSLDMSNNTALYELQCPNNQLTSLDVSSNTALNLLAFSGNQVTSLDVSSATSLTYLDCQGSQLIGLDVSANTALTTLYCNDNQLIYLNMKNGVTYQLANFNATNNSLDCIEVNEEDVDWATENWTYENNNIDEGVEFSVVCAPEGYSYVPDDNFEQALVDLGYDSAVDDFVLTENIAGLESLDVSSLQISDLTGIEDFTALTGLIAPGNELTSLDVSANTALTELSCYGNYLTSLDVSSNTAIIDLDCSNNQLISLDVNGVTALKNLSCSENYLTSLDVSANTYLTHLTCYGNQITSLDVSSNTGLQLLYANHNDLTSLDVSSNTALTDLYCNSNQLASLDVSSNTALVNLNCSSNQLASLDVSNNTALEIFNCSNNQLTYLNMKNGVTDQLTDPFAATFNATGNDLICIETLDPTWATENWTYENGNIDEGVEFSVVCVPEGDTYVPDDNFEQALIDLGYDDVIDDFVLTENISGVTYLEVYGQGISDLTGIEDFTALEDLRCENNQLTSLDMSNNTALTTLWCNGNQLTSLDVSSNTGLQLLYANHNDLTSLDVSSNTALTVLRCNENSLTSLDVSSNTALELLEPSHNDLTSLDVSNNLSLTELVCYDNQLPSLDVSNNTALTRLECNYNQLPSLDVSSNTALTSLHVDNNQLFYLNMKNGVTDALTTFDATDNSLTCIEVNEENVAWATENWTNDNGNIDEGASFTVCCMVSEDCLAPQAAFGVSEMYLAVVPGSETQYNISLANSGNLALDYTVSIDATSTVYTWLSTTVDSGQVPGDSTVSIPVTLEQTENLSAGTFTGYLYFGTNTGADLDVIIANTDTVTVTLNLMSDDAPFADTTVTVAAGNSDPIDFTDESGQSTGITVDFEYSDGGSVMVQSIGLPPPMDETPTWVDPDGLITEPVFPEKYFEISTDIAGDYWVDIGLDYTMLVGIDDPQTLRLAKRPGYAGASEPWTVIAVANTEINSTDGLVVAKSQTSFSQWAMISNASDNSFIDTQGPVISNFALAPAQPNILEEVTVTADLADDTGIAAATLYYMAGGSSGYTSVDMATSGGSYSGTIPGSDVSMAGLFYYIVAQDPLGLSTTSDTNGVSINFAAGSLTTSTAAGSAYPGGLPMDAWRLISIPAVLDEMGVGLVIGDELGAQDDNTWRMFEYDKTTSSYKANPVDFTMGESYWLYQRVEDNLSVATPAGETGNMSGTSLTIAPGWNFIGSPYSFSLPLALDQVQFYGPITYGLTGESWSSVVTELDPWNGYAVYNRTVSDKTIILDPGSTGAGLAARVTNNENGWLIQMSAASGIYKDSHNIFGQLESASNDLDWHDNPELLSPGNYLSVAFNVLHENSTIALTSDLRELSENVQVWDGEISGSGLTESVELSWNMEKVLPGDIAVKMIDLNTRNVLNLSALDEYLLGDLDDRYSRQIKIVAGDPEQVALTVDDILATIPEELSLEGNYPNPFNPVTTIRFGLPEPRKIRITVINLLGQEVTELVNGWRDMGHHEVVWQGVDGSGKAVATGMYFTVLSDGNKIIVQKMLLLK